MRCGRISVKGEAEEIAVSLRSRSRKKHWKRSNPYSNRGLDTFQSVYAELSAKREYIAKKTGAPEDMVRFVSSNEGWIPIVLGLREGIGKKNGGAVVAGASILGPVEKNNGDNHGELRRKDEGNESNGESERISISGLDERRHSLVLQCCRLRSAVSAAVVMAVGGVTCMKKFILSADSYFTTLFRNKRNPKTSQNEGGVEEIAEQKDVNKLGRRTQRPGYTVSAPSSPLRADVQPIEFPASSSPRPKIIDPEHKHHQWKAKKFIRVVSMENRPTRTAGPQGSDGFYTRTRSGSANHCTVGATVMIITLLCLVFYGRLCAIFFTSAWWYLLSILVEQRMRAMTRTDNSRMVDLQSSVHKMSDPRWISLQEA